MRPAPRPGADSSRSIFRSPLLLHLGHPNISLSSTDDVAMKAPRNPTAPEGWSRINDSLRRLAPEERDYFAITADSVLTPPSSSPCSSDTPFGVSKNPARTR